MPSSTDHANAVVGSIATIMRTDRSAESSLVLLDLRIEYISCFIPFVLIKKKPSAFQQRTSSRIWLSLCEYEVDGV